MVGCLRVRLARRSSWFGYCGCVAVDSASAVDSGVEFSVVCFCGCGSSYITIIVAALVKFAKPVREWSSVLQFFMISYHLFRIGLSLSSYINDGNTDDEGGECFPFKFNVLFLFGKFATASIYISGLYTLRNKDTLVSLIKNYSQPLTLKQFAVWLSARLRLRSCPAC